ncbi:MAG: hypothetical protein CVU29_06500 [Betaproteobacteria bacterium HGW-Betaproteobacteria-22]|nr:MAG: hypothetical protein CVU29_06500 [Betaproteobacteria bacterium HGW-Betaproteobacteria-22]
MDISREKQAISAYFKILQKKGAKTGMLYRRSVFLDELTALLAGKPLERSIYSKAIELTIKHVAENDWHDSLNTAREFYPFWMGDMKAIAAFNAKGGFDVDPLRWKPAPTTLKALTDRLPTEKYDATDARHLKAYTNALLEKGANKTLLSTRTNLAKILLMQLKGAPIDDARVYRTAVDSTLPLFKVDETKQLFLFVIREFYSYWIGNLNIQDKTKEDSFYN